MEESFLYFGKHDLTTFEIQPLLPPSVKSSKLSGNCLQRLNSTVSHLASVCLLWYVLAVLMDQLLTHYVYV